MNQHHLNNLQKHVQALWLALLSTASCYTLYDKARTIDEFIAKNKLNELFFLLVFFLNNYSLYSYCLVVSRHPQNVFTCQVLHKWTPGGSSQTTPNITMYTHWHCNSKVCFWKK